MRSMLTRLTEKLTQMRRDQRGVVAIILALSLVPMVGMVGLSIDYTQAMIAKSRLQAQIDTAALAGVRAAFLILSDESGSTPRALKAANRAVHDYWNTNSNGLKYVTRAKIKTYLNIQQGRVTITLHYKAVMDTSLAKLFNIKIFNLSGDNTSVVDLPRYINTYMVLDVSQSMGIAATASAREKLKRLTNIPSVSEGARNCEFACHFVESSLGKSSYTLARENNVDLRIDVLKNAAISAVQDAQRVALYPNQFKFDVTIFHGMAENVSPLSQETTKIVKAIRDNVDLSSVFWRGDTKLEVGLDAVNARLRQSGDGFSAATPKNLVVFISDGVADETDDGGTYQNRNAHRPGGVPSLPSDPWRWTYGSPALIPRVCQDIKRKGTTVAVLETTYNPIAKSAAERRANALSAYELTVKPWASAISPAMQTCASPGLHYAADGATEIAAALSTIFDKEVNPLRIAQ